MYYSSLTSLDVIAPFCVENNTIFTEMLVNKRPFVRVSKALIPSIFTFGASIITLNTSDRIRRKVSMSLVSYWAKIIFQISRYVFHWRNYTNLQYFHKPEFRTVQMTFSLSPLHARIFLVMEDYIDWWSYTCYQRLHHQKHKFGSLYYFRCLQR